MITIKQGKPISGRFKIFHTPLDPVFVNDTICCQHPQSGNRTIGIVYDVITMPWGEVPEWMCFDTYGVDTVTLKKSLDKKFPAHRNQEFVRVLLIKQTN